MRICRATYLQASPSIVMAPHESTADVPATTDAKPIDIRIRSYTAQDLAVVRDLFVNGMHEYCPPGHNEGLRNYVQRSLQDDMADIEGTYFASGGHFWVATTTDANSNEIIIGSIAIEGKEDNRGELRRLSVRSDYRRHGLGRKLVAHLENWATQQGKSAVFLNTGWEMAPAIKLYDALGYTLTHKHVFREEPYAALFFYEKKLGVESSEKETTA